MFDDIKAYLDLIGNIEEIKKPKMPKFDYSAYNDKNYKLAMNEINFSFDLVDDLDLTLNYLKEKNGNFPW